MFFAIAFSLNDYEIMFHAMGVLKKITKKKAKSGIKYDPQTLL